MSKKSILAVAENKLTLEQLIQEHGALGLKIAAFQEQANTAYVFPEQEIDLKPGEEYAGIIIGKDGAPSHHLILLPGQAEDLKWDAAMSWAKEQGGELPTRREQSLLYANVKEQFEERWYWSGEQYAGDSDSAWCQLFGHGTQGYSCKSNEFRVRAVRRLVIQ